MSSRMIDSGQCTTERTRAWPYSARTFQPPPSLANATVLLASDGSPPSEAATRVAAHIAQHRHAAVRVLGVMDTRSAPIPPPLDLALNIADTAIGSAVHDEQEAALRARLAATLGHSVEWPTTLALGTPADVIARESRRVRAALVVMGLRRHGLLDRAVHDETTLGVMRSAGCPVLGVTAETSNLPRRILVAMDFGRASVRAALAAVELLADGGTLTLVYVAPMTSYPPDDGEGVIRTLGVEAAFALMTERLEMADNTVDHVVLHHSRPASIASLLLDHAESVGAELIVAGSVRHGRVDRLLLGSVSAELARNGRLSTLIVPPDDV